MCMYVCGYVSLCGTCYSWAGIKASYRKLYGLCGIIINTYVNVFWLCLVNNNDMTAHLWLSGSDGNHENDSIRWTWSPCTCLCCLLGPPLLDTSVVLAFTLAFTLWMWRPQWSGLGFHLHIIINRGGCGRRCSYKPLCGPLLLHFQYFF